MVATQKQENLRGQKLLLVLPLDHDLKKNGELQVAVDTVQAGPGDLVFLVGSREAALALEPHFVAVDAAIVGIVDAVNVEVRPQLPQPSTAASSGSSRGARK